MTKLGRRAVVVAVVAAVLGGLSGIALGSWLSWRGVDRQAPDTATTAAVARAVLPGPVSDRIGRYGRSTFWNPYSENGLLGGTGVRAGRTTAIGRMPSGEGFEQVAAGVEQRMREQGWRGVRTTVERYESSATAEVTGTRDGLLAAVAVTSGDIGNRAEVDLALMWAEPPGHLRDTVLGGLAGALLGALLGLLTASRIRSHGPRRQRAYSWLCVAVLVLLTPACLANLPTLTGSLLSRTHRDGTGPRVFWGGFVVWGAEPLAILSVLPVLAVVLLCFWPRRTPDAAPGLPGAPAGEGAGHDFERGRADSAGAGRQR